MIGLLSLRVRLNETLGEVANLERYTSRAFVNLIKKHEKAILFFDDSEKPCEFAHFAVNKLKNNITFGISPEREGKGMNCKSYPCIVPFYKGKRVTNAPPAPLSSINFTKWCVHVFENGNHVIDHPEDLRRILESNTSVYFGIDMAERPQKLTNKKIHYYSVNSTIFKLLKIDVHQGLYFYNSQERNLRDIKDVIDNKVYITTISDPNLKDKKFWGGYAIDPQLESDNQLEFEIMTNLSKKYGDNFNFAPIYDAAGFDILREQNSLFFDIPFFIALESNGTGRWIVANRNEVHSVTFLDDFIGGIIDGSRKSVPLSDNSTENPRRHMREIGHDYFWETINQTTDSFVLFDAEQCDACLKMRLVVNKTASLLRENRLKIYHFNCSKNDIPEGLDIGARLPAFISFRNGKMAEKFDRREDIDDSVQWVKDVAREKVEIPPYSSHKVKDDISNEFYKLKKPEKFVITKTENRYDD